MGLQMQICLILCFAWSILGKFCVHLSGLLIFCGKKKQNFAGFSGANSRKNRPISREKSKNSRKNRPISREKSQNSPENRSISRDFSGKKSNFEGFSGANS